MAIDDSRSTNGSGVNGTSSSVIHSFSSTTDHNFNGRANVHANGNVNDHANGRGDGYANGHTNNYADDCHNEQTNGDAQFSRFIPEAIAICGVTMRLRGGFHDADGYWDVLYNGKDMRGPIPSDRYNAAGFDNKLGKKDAIKTQHGYFLNEDLSCLDASFFTMTKHELEKTDPQQRQILGVTRECLENAGEINYRGKQVGCYVGTFGEDWLQSLSKTVSIMEATLCVVIS